MTDHHDHSQWTLFKVIIGNVDSIIVKVSADYLILGSVTLDYMGLWSGPKYFSKIVSIVLIHNRFQVIISHRLIFQVLLMGQQSMVRMINVDVSGRRSSYAMPGMRSLAELRWLSGIGRWCSTISRRLLPSFRRSSSGHARIFIKWLTSCFVGFNPSAWYRTLEVGSDWR